MGWLVVVHVLFTLCYLFVYFCLSRMVKCIHCLREMHQVCVLHMDSIWNKGYQCDNCIKALGSNKKDNKYSAKRKMKWVAEGLGMCSL